MTASKSVGTVLERSHLLPPGPEIMQGVIPVFNDDLSPGSDPEKIEELRRVLSKFNEIVDKLFVSNN